MKFPCLRNEVVRNPENLDFGDWLSRYCYIIGALVEPHGEALKWIIGVLQLLKAGVVGCKVYCKYYGIVHI